MGAQYVFCRPYWAENLKKLFFDAINISCLMAFRKSCPNQFQMSRRIILFGPLPPPYGGVAIFMKSLVEHLRASEVRVWTYGGAKSGGKQTRFISHRLLGVVPALIKEARNARILDASHFHLEYPNALLLAAWLFLKPLLGFQWYKNIHDGSLPKRHAAFGAGRRWLFQRAVNAVDTFVVVSEELRRWLQEDLQVRQPVMVVPGLLPPQPDEQTNAMATETERVLEGYLSTPHRVCSIGVFYPSYGFKHVAKVVEQLRRDTGEQIGLLLLDGGFICDESYRKEVLSDRDWITVLEKVPHPEVQQILKRSNVFVRAFADESYGLSRIEALWAGVPVIATRAGETRGMLLYDFGDVKELVNHLRTVLLDAQLQDANAWPELYRKEAEENLQTLVEVLGVE
jgi:glycosyltransferase involved in cell wall biosynthesis